ncbi:MAG: AbrB/MazE/SpoVT family DNA-binding domain-containing protein [Chloroflexota bacterium]
MKVTIDRAGRLVVPRALREELDLQAGTQLEARAEGGQLIVTPAGPEVILIKENGRLVATTSDPVPDMTQEELLGLIDRDREWPHRL